MHRRCTRSPAEKEVRDNSRTGGPAPPPRAVRGACPTAKGLLDLHVHRLQKKTARGSDSEAKATANLMAAQLSYFEKEKKPSEKDKTNLLPGITNIFLPPKTPPRS